MPARTYSVSAEMDRALAICWRISADGLRSPRSIWLRYGFEIPARSESFRRVMRADSRCSRMKRPTSCQRASRSITPAAYGSRAEVLSQERFDRGLAGLVPAGDLGLEHVDALVEGAAAGGQLGLVGREVLHQGGQPAVVQLGEPAQHARAGDGIELRGVELARTGGEELGQAAHAGGVGAV